MYELFDFCNRDGDNLIAKWASGEKLDRRDRAQLDIKFDALALHGMDLIPRLLTSVKSHPKIMKLRVTTQRAFRPMLCMGPHDMKGEFTILLGAIEENFILKPHPDVATVNMGIVSSDKKRRVEHERFADIN